MSLEDIEVEIDGTKHGRFDIEQFGGKGPQYFVRIPKGLNKIKIGPDGVFVNGKKAKIEKYKLWVLNNAE